ncbi:MAG TPA: hypothetical protein VD813_03390 [Pseudonocardia sp.]|nr:hypothetical protein [Pseudonocardia sp.]
MFSSTLAIAEQHRHDLIADADRFRLARLVRSAARRARTGPAGSAPMGGPPRAGATPAAEAVTGPPAAEAASGRPEVHRALKDTADRRGAVPR